MFNDNENKTTQNREISEIRIKLHNSQSFWKYYQSNKNKITQIWTLALCIQLHFYAMH